MSTSNLKYSLVEGLTDESAIDFQVQELEDLLGVVGSLDEGGVVDWTHFERLKVVSCQDPFGTPFEDRIRPMNVDGAEEGSVTTRLYTDSY